MRSMKKVASLALVLVLCLSLSVGVWAEEPTTYTITISNESDGYTYEAYQIFDGTLTQTDDKTVLSDIIWGSGIDSNKQTALMSALKAIKIGDNEPFKTCTSAAAVAEILSANTTKNNDVAKAFAKTVASYLSTTKATSSQSEDKKSYTISVTDPGYYLIKNSSVASTSSFYTDYILEVVKDVQVTPKGSFPTSEKKVKDKNDSTGEETGWQNSADYDIGDDVPFQLTATLADNVTSYDVYKVVFHDTLSAGLTYNNDAVVTVGNTVVYNKNGGNNIAMEGVSVTHAGNTLTITIADVTTDAIGGGNSSAITVDYTAKMNSNATVGSTGNTNKMKLEYSNNPNNSGSGSNDTGYTPEDTVTVFTFKLEVNKTDGTNALKGAGFTLYKKYKTSAEGGTTTDDWRAVGSEVKGTDMTTFTWSGLDAGEYKLVETTTPPGYNTMEDMFFTIEATHNTTSDSPAVTELQVKDKDGNVISADRDNIKATFTATLASGLVSTTVVNQAGATLPETGGTGTTIFYVVGGMLAVLAAVLLITRKRMGAEN